MARDSWRDRVEAVRGTRVEAARAGGRRAVSHRQGARCVIDGRELLDFCQHDYLGLSQHFAVVGALQDALARDGAGSGGPHPACGHHEVHEQLQRELAEWLQVPAAILFGSRYLANLAVLPALLGEEDACVADRSSHPGVVDGARLAGCRLRRYPHADPEGAIRQLRNVPTGLAVLATEAVAGGDGDLAPLRQLALVAKVQHALLYVDDSHGLGVVGPGGRGSIADAGLGHAQVPLQLLSLGHALGTHGAAVAGDAALVAHLAGHARPYLHEDALPPAQAAAALAALRLARDEHWRRERLAALATRFRDGARRAGLVLLASDSPILPVLVGDTARAVSMSARLEALGFRVQAICPPAVAEGRARLRVVLTALHAPADIDALLAALARARDIAEAEARVAQFGWAGGAAPPAGQP